MTALQGIMLGVWLALMVLFYVLLRITAAHARRTPRHRAGVHRGVSTVKPKSDAQIVEWLNVPRRPIGDRTVFRPTSPDAIQTRVINLSDIERATIDGDAPATEETNR